MLADILAFILASIVLALIAPTVEAERIGELVAPARRSTGVRDRRSTHHLVDLPAEDRARAGYDDPVTEPVPALPQADDDLTSFGSAELKIPLPDRFHQHGCASSIGRT